MQFKIVSTKAPTVLNEVLDLINGGTIKTVVHTFRDLNGDMRQTEYSVDAFQGLATLELKGLDASSFPGWQGAKDTDRFSLPDAATKYANQHSYFVYPSEPDKLYLMCTVVNKDGSPYKFDPVHYMRAACDRLEKIAGPGAELLVGREHEVAVMAEMKTDIGRFGSSYQLVPVSDAPPKVSYRVGAAHQDPLGKIRDEIRDTLVAMGVPEVMTHAEVASSQIEVVARYSNANTALDRDFIVHYVIHRVCEENGYKAIFMAKWDMTDNGNGKHAHFSVKQGGSNLFADPEHPGELSDFALRFIQGVVTHGRAGSLFTNPSAVSGVRFREGFETPRLLAAAHNSRQAAVRVPLDPKKPTTGDAELDAKIANASVRAEYRVPDNLEHPALTMAFLIMAGTYAIEHGLPPAQLFDGVDLFHPHEFYSKNLTALKDELKKSIGADKTLRTTLFDISDALDAVLKVCALKTEIGDSGDAYKAALTALTDVDLPDGVRKILIEIGEAVEKFSAVLSLQAVPADLSEAVQAFESGSDYLKADGVFTAEFIKHYAAFKRAEVQEVLRNQLHPALFQAYGSRF